MLKLIFGIGGELISILDPTVRRNSRNAGRLCQLLFQNGTSSESGKDTCVGAGCKGFSTGCESWLLITRVCVYLDEFEGPNVGFTRSSEGHNYFCLFMSNMLMTNMWLDVLIEHGFILMSLDGAEYLGVENGRQNEKQLVQKKQKDHV